MNITLHHLFDGSEYYVDYREIKGVKKDNFHVLDAVFVFTTHGSYYIKETEEEVWRLIDNARRESEFKSKVNRLVNED